MSPYKVEHCVSFPFPHRLYASSMFWGYEKNCLITWICGNLKVRLPTRMVNILSKRLLSLKSFVPSEINRKPRSISELPGWKSNLI